MHQYSLRRPDRSTFKFLGKRPSAPLASTTQGAVVSIGGVEVPALFSGLVPGLVGFYQVNATVPPGVAASSNVPVFLTIGGVTSNTVTIAVE
jgi:uncharacterized protein (TIGR03437 family)